jgi:hypothetical protein
MAITLSGSIAVGFVVQYKMTTPVLPSLFQET